MPIDWPGLVSEALRRRKKEGLTQKEHAALAGVSVPTIISFDRSETKISLAKALDILRVVGLVTDHSPLSSQDTFVELAEGQWQELVKNLPPEAPARHVNGHYTFDYEIIDISFSSTESLLNALQQADHKYTGWPPFWIPTRKAIAPYPFDGGVECWLGRPERDKAFQDAAHSDFWRATLDARFYLRRGYQEDSTDNLLPATVFDLTLPIWRAGEAVLHAYHLAELMKASTDSSVRFRSTYAGLTGRELKSWANPYRRIPDNYRCRIGDITTSVTFNTYDVEKELTNIVHSLLNGVFDKFDFFEISKDLIKEELENLKNRAKKH